MAPPPPSPGAPPPRIAVSVGRGVVTACKTSEGESLKGAECGRTASLDRLVAKSLQKLAECPSAADNPDKVRLVVRADFVRGALAVSAHKGAMSEALVACAKSALEGVSLDGVPHVNPRVTVSYSVAFEAASTEPPADRPPSPREETGTADHAAPVVWDVALVRDTPRTGRVTARLKQGTVVRLGPVQDGWYPVKFGDAFANDGWIYGAAIGR
jgi:hypothetical protein